MRTTPPTLAMAFALLACVLLACDGRVGDLDEDPNTPPIDVDSPLPPPPRLHRLNRLEYNNSVRHLLGTSLEPANAFPPDGASSGLDNIAESLTLTPTLLNAYYTAATEVVDDALNSAPSYLVRRSADELPPVGEAVGSFRALNGQVLELSENLPGGALELVFEAVGIAFGAELAPAPLQPTLDVEVDGVLFRSIVVRGSATAPAQFVFSLDLSEGAHTVRFRPTNFARAPEAGYGNDVHVVAVEFRGPSVPGPGVERVFVCEPTPPELVPVEVRRHVPNPAAFAAWRFGAVESTPTDGWTDGPPLPLAPRVVIFPGDPRVFVVDVDSQGEVLRHVLNPDSLIAWRLNEQALEELPVSVRDAMRIGLPWSLTPRLVQGATPHVYIVDSIPSVSAEDYDLECYRTIVLSFARRAWRRALEADEQDELYDFWHDLVVAGESPDDAVRLTLRRVLVAPDFIYRHRRSPADLEWLASRLSYFLWSSTPDEALLQEAADGTLDDDEVLRRHVRRMLADGRADALVDGFGEQWLSTRRLAQLQPSEETFPEADGALMSSMEAESRGFFQAFLSSERPVASMLSADFAMLDDWLASHYNMPPTGSAAMEEVSPSEGRPSVLSLSAWLALHVHGDHPSAIQRGRWLADHVLCDPVPPPPAGLAVPSLDFEDGLSVRAQLEQHRADPVCASCHVRLDILGMGFERYDALGRVRDEPSLDSLGTLPGSSTTFDGAEEMAAAMDREAFVSCLTRWLFTYALGRAPVGEEGDALDRIAEEATRADWSLADVLEAIALSDGFRGHELSGERLPGERLPGEQP